MQHKGGETPYAGGDEKQGEYPIDTPLILPQHHYRQDSEQQKTN
jgi:hypothetical protein